MKIDSDSKPYISMLVKDADGNIIEDEGKFYNILNETGAVYNLEGIRYKSNNRNTAVATFIEDGYLRIKFSNYSLDITYSLTDKSAEEISMDGFIPEAYRGLYVLLIQDSDYTSTATVYSDRVTYNRTYYISNYIGKNTWYCGSQFSYSDMYIEFLRNEKTQRVLYDTGINSSGRKYTNVYVHSEDKDK